MSRRYLVFVAALFLATSAHASDISSTRHNLSVTGPGTVTALNETRICVFCHTPHNADPVAPLWNRTASSASYTPYASSSLDAAPGQPTGSSKLCLSCHDGTIALGEVLSETTPIPMVPGASTMPPGTTNLGFLLHDDHPVSFPYTVALASADGHLADPGTLTGPVRLDENGEVQCTSCHDPHDDTNGDFLVQDNTGSAICSTCHDRPEWVGGSHGISARTWNGMLPDPWPHTSATTVAANACENCHNPHSAADSTRLMNQTPEEANCLACHNGNVATTDLEAEFAKAYVHPIAATEDVHDSEETALVTSRHVECEDCHNPHAVKAAGASAPDVSGWQIAVRGIDTDGNAVEPALYQYETCYRCHADSPGKPLPNTPRQFPENNVRLQFDLGNASYHPVEGAGMNPDVPSLIGGWSTNSVMYCVDCHTNDAATGGGGGGGGPVGPHGSIWPALLGWQYETGSPQESMAAYNLCYRCHSRGSILGDNSFDEHDLHIVDERASCNVCHDPHGVSGNTHLINFDTSVVSPYNGKIEFLDNGRFNGSCQLTCHAEPHDPFVYRPRAGGGPWPARPTSPRDRRLD